MKKIIFLLLLFALGIFCYFLTTPSGLKWSVHRIENCIPGKLSIQRIDGALFSGFTLEAISYETQNKKITVSSLAVHWKTRQVFLKNAIVYFENESRFELNGALNQLWNFNWKFLSAKNNLNIRGVLSGAYFSPIIKVDNFYLSSLGITIKNTRLYPKIINRKIIFSGDFTSGSGTGKIKGTIGLITPLELEIEGRDLECVNLPDYKAAISPRISLKLNQTDLILQGNIDITHAKITPRELAQDNSLPEEVVFVGKTEPKTPSLQTSLKLNLHLTNDVFLNYKELRTHVRGDLLLSKNPQNPATATGTLYSYEGTYEAYGKLLEIENGRVIYTGNLLTNPGLDIRAVRKIRTVLTNETSQFSDNTPFESVYNGTKLLTVGIKISGTAKNPRIILFSDPAGLSQKNILSYLLLGYAESQAKGGNLLGLLSTLNPNSAPVLNKVIARLEKKLGLTDLQVEPMEVFNPASQTIESTTSLSVGKQLSPKLYLHYSIGLFNPIAILSLRYQLSRHWAIKSENSSMDNGADVVYEIESE